MTRVEMAQLEFAAKTNAPLRKLLDELTKLGPVTAEVIEERWRQDEKWGGPSHDDHHHDPGDWCTFIGDRVDDMFDLTNGFGTEEEAVEDRGMYRRKMIHVAALAIAAIESFDRCEKASGRG